METTTNPPVGSVGYDVANNLKLGTSSSYNPYSIAPSGGGQSTFADAPIAPTGQPANVTGTSLATASLTPVPTPTNTANTTAQSVIGGVGGEINALQSLADEQQKKADEAKKNAESLNPLLKQFGGLIGTKGDLQTQEEQKAGTTIAGDLARGLTQEYQTKQLGYNQVLASIYNDPRSTKEQKAAFFENASRQHAFDLTDLSIRQNIAVGNYQALQDSVDKRVNLLYGDIKDKYDYLLKFREEYKSDLTKAEDNKLQIQIKKAEDESKKADALKTTINTLLQMANANNAPANVKEAIAKAKTEQEAIVNAGQYGVDLLAREVQRANIEQSRAAADASRASAAKSRAEIPTTTTQETKNLSTVNDIENLLSSSEFNNIWGLTGYAKTFVPGSPANLAKAQATQVIDSLALAARGQLKGQGAVSDFEGKTLKQASTALNFNLNADQARQELQKVKGAIRTSSGLTATVKITNPKTGESGLADVDSKGITKAIADGLQVEYQ